MESQPQIAEFRNNPENFYLWMQIIITSIQVHVTYFLFMYIENKFLNTMLSLYNTHHYNIDLDTTQSRSVFQNVLPWNLTKKL